MNTVILPVIDTEALQKKANEYAMKGAEESLKEFYTGWNSPYRKKIDEELKKHEIGTGIELPDIVALINEKLEKEVNTIANKALAKTFIPQVKRFLTRADAEIKFSDILKEYIEVHEDLDRDSCEVSIKEDSKWGWLDVHIESDKAEYSFTLHVNHESEKEKTKKYKLLGLPREVTVKNTYKDTMKLTVDGATLELPFRRDILEDRFVSYLASIVICSSLIIMDCDNFHEDMFPEKCHCH